MKPTVTNCFPCWTEDQRATPATWAHGDDFYCDLHLRTEGIDVGECETIEAWRAAHGQPVHIPEVEARREVQAAAGRKNGKPDRVRLDLSMAVCKCGKPARHRGRCRRIEGSASNVATPRANGGSTEPSNSGHTTGPISPSASQKPSNRENGNGHFDVGTFKVRTVALDTYMTEMSSRLSIAVYAPIIAHARAMKPNMVSIIDCPKDVSPKAFRNRLAKFLQNQAKLPVRLEMRPKENAVAIIREGRG
jgi:hypothetical protein